jgi:hypothetical protein
MDPNYALSTGQLFRNTSELILKRARNVDVVTAMLSFAGRSNQSLKCKIPSWAVEWDYVAKDPVRFKLEDMPANKNFFGASPPLSLSPSSISCQVIIVDEVKEIHVPRWKSIMDPETDGVDLLKFFFNDPPMEILPFVVLHRPRYRTGIFFLTAVLSTLLLGRDVLSRNDYDRLFIDKVPCENFRRSAMLFLRLLENWNCVGIWALSINGFVELQRQFDGPPETWSAKEQKRVDETIDKIFGFRKGCCVRSTSWRRFPPLFALLMPPLSTTKPHSDTRQTKCLLSYLKNDTSARQEQVSPVRMSSVCSEMHLHRSFFDP